MGGGDFSCDLFGEAMLFLARRGDYTHPVVEKAFEPDYSMHAWTYYKIYRNGNQTLAICDHD